MRRVSGRMTGLAGLGSVLKRSLDASGLSHKVAEGRAMDKWSEVVGPQIAGVTVPETVRDGVLFVACKNSMWASELSLHSREIMKKLAQCVGRRVVSDIRFSSRGFKRALESKVSEESEPDPASVSLSEAEKDFAAKTASAAEHEELARKIESAVLAGKRRQKAIKGE